MGLGRTISAVAAVSAMLSACNTTDAMIPRVGIGEGSTALNSTPVTQDDTERMARAPVGQQALAAPTGGVYRGDAGPSYSQAPAYPPSAGSGTLEGQADAIRTTGSNPYRSAPLAGGAEEQAMQANEQAEADRRLSETPRAQAPREEQALPPQPEEQAQQPEEQAPQQQGALPPATADGNTIRFLPIIGAPVDAVTPLSRELGAEARARGLSIKGSADSSANYILKGYLSAFEDGPQVTVSYVWDVLDSNGERLHRIQGSESAPLKAGDPWAAVPANVMQKIADKTIAEFAGWRQSRGG